MLPVQVPGQVDGFEELELDALEMKLLSNMTRMRDEINDHIQGKRGWQIAAACTGVNMD